MKHVFRRIAAKISAWTGTATVFLGAVLVIVIWGLTGPVFGYSDTWQLVINTGTTIVTFLMVFLIQNTQNRDSKAVQLKLDELIHATKGARTHFVGLEDLSDEDLAQLDTEFKKLATNQNSARALVKLHEKIEAEHTRRITLGQASTAVLQKLHIVPASNPELAPVPTEDKTPKS
jgi:low affinity Fe/Cu permease